MFCSGCCQPAVRVPFPTPATVTTELSKSTRTLNPTIPSDSSTRIGILTKPPVLTSISPGIEIVIPEPDSPAATGEIAAHCASTARARTAIVRSFAGIAKLVPLGSFRPPDSARVEPVAAQQYTFPLGPLNS